MVLGRTGFQKCNLQSADQLGCDISKLGTRSADSTLSKPEKTLIIKATRAPFPSCRFHVQKGHVTNKIHKTGSP